MDKKYARLSDVSKSSREDALYNLIDAARSAYEDDYDAEKIDDWLDGEFANQLPDFVWHAVYAMKDVMDSIENNDC